MTRLENEYQMELIPKIYALFPGEPLVDILVIINDPNYIQGIPDLSVFFRNRWGMLEVKASEKSRLRPNQQWWVDQWAKTTFCSFIYPENEEEVLNALQQALLG
jgi:hypothetical protein